VLFFPILLYHPTPRYYSGGVIRYWTAIESLTGLVGITWTASFRFIEMQKYGALGRVFLELIGLKSNSYLGGLLVFSAYLLRIIDFNSVIINAG
jgi:hypothetical protein